MDLMSTCALIYRQSDKAAALCRILCIYSGSHLTVIILLIHFENTLHFYMCANRMKINKQIVYLSEENEGRTR